MATVRLAQLRAEAGLEARKYADGARTVTESDQRMRESQRTVGEAMVRTQARAGDSARAFDRLRASLDPLYRAQLQLEGSSRRVDAALARGQISAATHAQLMATIAQRAERVKASLGGLPEVLTRLSASMNAANQAMVRASLGGVVDVFGNLKRSVDSVNGSFEAHRRAIDPLYNMQRRLVEGQTMWRDALARGAITQAEFTRGMQLMNREAVAASAGLTGMAASMSRYIGLAAGFAAIGVARGVFDTAVAFERVESALVAATGSTARAAVEFAFVRAESERLGLNLQSTALDYSRLAAAAKGTVFEGELTRNIFLAVAEAATVLKLPTEQASGALSAIQQIISKGTVSMEELRQQLGDRLPGALQIAARAMGLTTAQLVDMVSKGNLAADQFLPKLANEMRKTYADAIPNAVGSAQAAVNRFENAYAEMQLELAKSGALDAAVEAINGLRDVMKDPQLLQGLREIGGGIRAVADALKTAAEWAKELRGYLPEIAGINPADIAGGGPGAMLKLYGARGSIAEALKPAGPQYSTRPTDLFDRGYSTAPTSSFRPIRVTPPLPVSRSTSGGGSRGESEAAREAREAEQRQEALDNYIKGLETELRLLKLTAVEREKEQAILDATRLIQNDRIKGEEQLSAEVKQQIADRAELLFLEREQQEETKRRAEEDARALEDQRQKVQEFEKEVVGELAASIADIWEGSEGGIDRTLDYWRKRIIAWLSEMAAKLILQPIIAPIIQSVTGGLGLGDAAGGIGANFGSSGVGGVSSLGASLGSLGKSIDQLGRDLGLQLGGATGPFEANTGLFGTTTFLSDVAGGALGGIGIGSTVASLTGGNSLGGSIGGLVGGALGSFLGPLGSMLGGAVGGFLGGLLGPKPTNATARIDFDEGYNRTQVPFSKETAETRAAINNAADQIVGVVKGLESVGTTFTDRLTAIAIGVRDESYIQFESGALLRSAVGDPNALALTAIKELLRGARFESQSLATVAGRDFGSLEELTSALDFVRNTYDAIAEAKPAMTGAEQAMKDLTDGLKAARKEAERLGLSVEKLDAGARTLFDRDISDQIRAITDPVGLAMEQAERDARARLDVAKQLGADLVQVERLNALQREQVLAQAAQQNFAGLRSLIDDISFGGLSAAAPSEQYFSALTRYNDAKRLATELGTPEALADYESSARAVLPIARSFLGTSQRYGELQNDVLATARTLSTPKPVDPALIGNAIIEATQASYAIVDEVKGLRGDNRDMQELLKRFTAQITAFLDRKAA